MVSRRYNSQGRLTGYTKSSKDIEQERQGYFLLLGIAVVLAPFAPLLYSTYYVYRLLNTDYGVHSLFAGILASIPTLVGLLLLIGSRVFRVIYFGAYTIVGTELIWEILSSGQNDKIWAGFFTLMAFILGALITGASYYIGAPEKSEPSSSS